MGTLNRFCHRALLLERGSMVHLGEPHEVADRYLEINFGRDPQAAGRAGDDGAWRRRRGPHRRGLGRGRARRAPGLAAPGPADHAQGAACSFMVDVEDPGGQRVRAQRRPRGRASSPPPTVSTSAAARFAAGEEVAVLVLLRQRPRPRPLQPAVHARPPRHGPRSDGPLRGRLLVRRHRPRSAWVAWSTSRSR